jgi:AraC-like DNA-binding protein
MVSKYTIPAKSVYPDFKVIPFDGFILADDRNNQNNRFYTLILIKSGTGSLKIDFNMYSARKNRIFLIDKYRKIYWNQSENLEGIILQFTDNFYNQIYTGNPKIKSDQTLTGEFPPSIIIDPEEESEWNNLVDSILREYSKKFENSREIICLCLKVLIMFYRRKASLSDHLFIADRKQKIISDFTKLLNSRFNELKTSKDFAEHLNISPNYLNAVCKEILNKTVSHYIRERIILEARRLLTHTELTVSEISFRLGFKDNSYFGRYFKKAVGISPERFKIANYNLKEEVNLKNGKHEIKN